MRYPLRFVVGVMLMWLTAHRAAGAQEIAGTVLSSAGGGPAAGVIVEARDSAGTRLGRVLTDARGRYRLAVPAGVSLSLRALRIGELSTSAGSLTVDAGQRRDLDIVLGGVSVTLPRVRVVGSTRCGAARRDDSALVPLLEELRKSLLATRLSDEGALREVTWIMSHVYFNRRGRETGREPALEYVGRVPRPFVSAPADSLAARGYLVESARDYVFYAPDADVLLSESFLSMHCFRAVPWRGEDRDWVGVAFRPESLVDNRVDIAGIAWIDRRTGALQFLEFSYVNVPRSHRMPDLGGEVHFLQLVDGSWLVHEWLIRSPHFTERTSLGTGSGTTRRVLTGRQDYGGVVREIRRGGELIYRRPPDDSSAVRPSQVRRSASTLE